MLEKSVTILKECYHILAYAHHENEVIPPCICKAIAGSLARVLKLEGAIRNAETNTQEQPATVPNVPDWRDRDAAIETIRRHLHAGPDVLTLSEQIDRILNLGYSRKEIAAMMGINRARVTEAYNGRPRKSFLIRFAELFGTDGGAAENPADDGEITPDETEGAKKRIVRDLAKKYPDAGVAAQLDKILATADVTGAELAEWLGISKKLVSNVRCGHPSPSFAAAWRNFITQEA